MSLFRRVLGLDAPESPDLPVAPDAPLPTRPCPGETQSVRMIVRRAERACRRPAPATSRPSPTSWVAPRTPTSRCPTPSSPRCARIGEVAGLDAETTKLVVDMSATLSAEFGATEDFLVTREFKAISTMEERHRLLRACFLVMAADDEVDANEAWLVNRVAEELDVERTDLNAIRAEFHERLASVKAVREVAQG